MAFTLEDGSIVAAANAYVSVDEFKDYHSDRANAYTATDPQIQAAIIKATSYIDGEYRSRWKGQRVSVLQSLQWPRYYVLVDPTDASYLASDAIPQALKDATCEAALRAITADLAPDLERGGKVKREKVDVIETEYTDGAPVTTSYQVIDQLLGGLLKNSNELVRA